MLNLARNKSWRTLLARVLRSLCLVSSVVSIVQVDAGLSRVTLERVHYPFANDFSRVLHARNNGHECGIGPPGISRGDSNEMPRRWTEKGKYLKKTARAKGIPSATDPRFSSKKDPY